MSQTATSQSSREAALARRRAMSSTGKAALGGSSNAGRQAAATARTASPAAVAKPVAQAMQGQGARTASRARREAMSTNGKAGIQNKDRVRGSESAPVKATNVTATASGPAADAADNRKEGGCGCGCKGRKETTATATDASVPARKVTVRNNRQQRMSVSAGRAASLARREAMSQRGKAAIGKNGMTAAQTARAVNPGLSGRELAHALRDQRSRNGKSGEKKSTPCGRVRPRKGSESNAGAEDAPWKVGASETGRGQTVTGTMVGRSHSVTGDEPSTCRTVTGTEYLGADIFRDFCQSDPKVSPRKVAVTTTSHGNSVSGNRLGRASNVTGNEPGTCKRVTGNEYISAEQSQAYCGEFMKKSPRKVTASETRNGKSLTGSNVGRSDKVTGDESGASRQLTGTQYMQSGDGKAPVKVGVSSTLRGGSVTGTMTGRSDRVTGDEPGSCRNITGDDYVGQEQYQAFCDKTPAPNDQKVGVSATLTGKTVTGTMTGRSGRVTGDEPGTCKAVTGTPYAGAEQYAGYCKPEDANLAAARRKPSRGTPGAVMTGQQPAVGGVMTGDARGACEDVTGTPYVGADQFAQACPAAPADTVSPDFPQPIGNSPWGQFSVSSPAGEAQNASIAGGITGNRYEDQSHITGPFGMASGKVTGTEEARFGVSAGKAETPATAPVVEGRVKSRITGEGMDAGPKITGDDWERGDNVTGTEGRAASGRNPTKRGVQNAMSAVMHKRNTEMVEPVSKVTGGSGNTDHGALVTYSGGARG